MARKRFRFLHNVLRQQLTRYISSRRITSHKIPANPKRPKIENQCRHMHKLYPANTQQIIEIQKIQIEVLIDLRKREMVEGYREKAEKFLPYSHSNHWLP